MTATKLPEALLLIPNRCAVYLKGTAMKIAIGIVVGFVVAILLIRILENRLIYFPPRYPTGFVPPEHYGLQVEEVWMTTEDGVKLNGYFLPQASSPSVLLWFHGNAENIGFGLEQMKILANLSINILEVDYRGYGKSEGSPDEPGIYRDADAAYEVALISARSRGLGSVGSLSLSLQKRSSSMGYAFSKMVCSASSPKL